MFRIIQPIKQTLSYLVSDYFCINKNIIMLYKMFNDIDQIENKKNIKIRKGYIPNDVIASLIHYCGFPLYEQKIIMNKYDKYISHYDNMNKYNHIFMISNFHSSFELFNDIHYLNECIEHAQSLYNYNYNYINFNQLLKSFHSKLYEISISVDDNIFTYLDQFNYTTHILISNLNRINNPNSQTKLIYIKLINEHEILNQSKRDEISTIILRYIRKYILSKYPNNFI